MARLITLEEDGPLGPSGLQVWVDDEPATAEKAASAPSKASAPRKTTTRKS